MLATSRLICTCLLLSKCTHCNLAFAGGDNCFYRACIAAIIEGLCVHNNRDHVQRLAVVLEKQRSALSSCQLPSPVNMPAVDAGHTRLQVGRLRIKWRHYEPCTISNSLVYACCRLHMQISECTISPKKNVECKHSGQRESSMMYALSVAQFGALPVVSSQVVRYPMALPERRKIPCLCAATLHLVQEHMYAAMHQHRPKDLGLCGM